MGPAVILGVFGEKDCIYNHFNTYFCDSGFYLPFALYLVYKSCVYEDASTMKHFDTLGFLHLKQQHYLK